LGAAALGSSLEITSDYPFQYSNKSASTPDFKIDTQGNIDLNGNDIRNTGAINTEQVFTRSRCAAVVVRKEASGTVYADGSDGEVTSGSDAALVIQAALDTGEDIHIARPADGSAYLISSPLVDNASDRRITSSRDAVLKANGLSTGDAVFATDATNIQQKSIYWEGITVDCAYESGVHGLHIDGTLESQFIAPRVTNHEGHGIRCTSQSAATQDCQWYSPYVSHSGDSTACIFFEAPDGTSNNAHEIYSPKLKFNGTGTKGIHLLGEIANINIYGGNCSNNAGSGGTGILLETRAGETLQDIATFGTYLELGNVGVDTINNGTVITELSFQMGNVINFTTEFDFSDALKVHYVEESSRPHFGQGIYVDDHRAYGGGAFKIDDISNNQKLTETSRVTGGDGGSKINFFDGSDTERGNIKFNGFEMRMTSDSGFKLNTSGGTEMQMFPPGDGRETTFRRDNKEVFKLHDDQSRSLVAQDLSALTLGSAENGRIYRHDGSNSISADGGTTSSPGYYVWANSTNEFKSLAQF